MTGHCALNFIMEMEGRFVCAILRDERSSPPVRLLQAYNDDKAGGFECLIFIWHVVNDELPHTHTHTNVYRCL